MTQLTPNQARLLHFVFKSQGFTGITPTIREMTSELGMKDHKSVSDILDALVKKGYIRREPRKSRSVRLTAKAGEFLGDYLLPIEYRHWNMRTAADDLQVPRDFSRADAAVLYPNSEPFTYEQGPITTNGTQLGGDIHTIVEAAVSFAVDRYFTGTVPHKESVRKAVTESVTGLVVQIFSNKFSFFIFVWAITLTALTWANLYLFSDGLRAMEWSIIEYLLIMLFIKLIPLR